MKIHLIHLLASLYFTGAQTSATTYQPVILRQITHYVRRGKR